MRDSWHSKLVVPHPATEFIRTCSSLRCCIESSRLPRRSHRRAVRPTAWSEERIPNRPTLPPRRVMGPVRRCIYASLGSPMLSSLDIPKKAFAVENSSAESAVRLAEPNEWPRGHLVFDSEGRITHLSSGVQEILELPSSPALGDDIYVALKATFDADPSTCDAVKQWVGTSHHQARTVGVSAITP